MSGFREAVWSMKRFLLIVFSYWSIQWTWTDVADGFYRTLVSCEVPLPHKGICPGGSFYENAQCNPKPPGDVDWSGSPHCFDKDYVLTETTQFKGLFYAVALLAMMLGNVFIANALLDKIGRRKIMVMSMAAYTFLISCFALSCRSSKIFIVLGGVLGAIFNSFQAAQIAMTADLATANESSRTLQMGAVSAFQNLGVTAGFCVGFFILRADITDYFYVWVAFSVAALLFTIQCWCLLEETFESLEGMAACSRRCHCLSTCRDLFFSLSQIKQDTFLLYACMCHFLFNFAFYGTVSISGSWSMAICGYSQAVSSLGGVLQPACISIAGITISKFLRILGAYHTCIFAIIVVTVGMVIVGLGGFAQELAGGFYWCGWAIVGFGVGQYKPSCQALLSVRAPDNFQGRLAAVEALIEILAAASGNVFSSNVLFKLEGTDSNTISPGRLVLPWTFNAVVCLASACIMWSLQRAKGESSPLLLGGERSDPPLTEDSANTSLDTLPCKCDA